MTNNIQLIQTIDYDALCAFKEYCDMNKIRFYLRGGSVMGAVKYNGFVPWDDDMDVAIPRAEYNKLVTMSKNLLLCGKYRIISYKNENNMHCYYLRMVLTEEERKKNSLPCNTNMGFHLMDIFPLDGSPNNSFVRKVYILKVGVLRLIASLGTHYCGEWKDMHSYPQQILINCMRIIGMEKLFPQKKVYEWLDILYSKYSMNNSKYIGTITASLFAKELMPASIWGDGTFMRVRDLSLRVPEQYDLYLKRLYGNNYMEKEPKRKKSHLGS